VFDYSKVRAKGEPIKTAGGKAPGHEGLKQSLKKIKTLLDYIIEVKKQHILESINAYDIVMHLSDAVLSGGIRRAAILTAFEKDDDLMLNSKTNFEVGRKIGFEKIVNKKGDNIWEGRVTINSKYGGFEGVKYDVSLTDYEYNDLLCKQNVINWVHIEPQRARSNNSVVLIRKDLKLSDFKKNVERIRNFGEPGFILADDPRFLVNPCAELGVIPVTKDGICGVQFCNLTSINGKMITNKETFKVAVKAATIIGTLQAGFTNFNYLSPAAKKLTENESLLGVSITGMMDNPDILLNPDIQKEMAEIAKKVNKEWSKTIGINQAARTLLCKPEGSTSILLGTASGIHPHHARKYFRRIQCNKEDNVYKHFKQYNPHAIEESVWSATKVDDIVTFPLQVSDKSIIKKDLSAIKHLKYILSTQKNWVLNGETERNHPNIHHNVSCTVIVDDKEWEDVINFIYDHREYFTAVAFISNFGDKIYKQTPMEEVLTVEDQNKFDELVKNWKPVDYNKLIEHNDETTLQKESACGANGCELTHV
jgi:ribonucleoside-diphosphate reductase alpha chain